MYPFTQWSEKQAGRYLNRRRIEGHLKCFYVLAFLRGLFGTHSDYEECHWR